MLKLYVKTAATTFVMTCGVITGLKIAFEVADYFDKNLTITLSDKEPEKEVEAPKDKVNGLEDEN